MGKQVLYNPNKDMREGPAYAMGLTSGWGTAEKDVMWGFKSESKRIKAPLFPT